MRQRIVADVEHLPHYQFGAGAPTWWGTWAFILIEGTGFAITIAAYLYLAYHATQWPIAAPAPELIWGSLTTVLLVLSVIPYVILDRVAHAEDRRRTQVWLVIAFVFDLAVLAARGMEFTALNVRYDENAYGSIVWVTLGLHTLHVVTDAIETGVLTVLMFTRHGHGRRFTDVSDGSMYWYFIVASWLALYALLYWYPRL